MSLKLLIIFSFPVALLLRRIYCQRKLPPGPPGIPFLGNIFDLPPKNVPEHQHWLQHKAKYGTLSSIRILGQTLVIIHDQSIATHLLERNVRKTSGRPTLEFALNLCGYGSISALRQHDAMHKQQRKLIYRHFGGTSWAARFENVQRLELIRLLQQVLKKEAELINQIKIAIGAMILKATYGYQTRSTSEHPLIRMSERVMNNFSEAAMPMTWAVDTIPMLRYLPRWFPGASFRRNAETWKSVLEEASQTPFHYAAQRRSSGEDNFSYVSRALEQVGETGHENVKWSAITLFGAGTDTTFATLKSFILAMVKFPEVQARGQEELDAVIGRDRLPTLDDRPKLPYIDAMVKEIYRWHPAGPLSLPHRTDAEMEYNGYYIPKGSVVLAAVRWFCHNPESYTSPEIFDPSRFLGPHPAPDPKQVVFGFGQRNCLGRHFADATIFQSVALVLAAFNVEVGLDGAGKPLDIVVESTTGLLDHVKPFPYKVTARNPMLDQLIDNEMAKMLISPA